MPDITRDESMDELLGQIEGSGGAESEECLPVGKRIHEVRERGNVTLRALAERTGFSEALLSQVENHMASPPLGMVVRIACALGTTVSDLLGEGEGRDFSIVRKGEHGGASRVGNPEGGRTSYSYQSLGTGKANRRMEPFLVRLSPPDPHAPRSVHDGEEFLYVLEGDVEIVLDRFSDVLHPGDSAYYSSSIPHHVHSAGEGEAVILAVLTQG
jgi:transcriptional regulator with XRE-family HTH domain